MYGDLDFGWFFLLWTAGSWIELMQNLDSQEAGLYVEKSANICEPNGRFPRLQDLSFSGSFTSKKQNPWNWMFYTWRIDAVLRLKYEKLPHICFCYESLRMKYCWLKSCTTHIYIKPFENNGKKLHATRLEHIWGSKLLSMACVWDEKGLPNGVVLGCVFYPETWSPKSTWDAVQKISDP